MTTHTTGLMEELTELWSAERCGVDWRFEENTSEPWCLLLSWVQEYGNLHQADWCEWTWQFYGETFEDAIVQAVDWARGLIPFEQCGACDGRGWYQATPDIRRQCDECAGTGFSAEALAAQRLLADA